jgi:signal transduction histidine kinase
MKQKIKLQTRLLIAVGLVLVTAFILTAWFVTSVEKKDLEASELKRIHLKSESLTRRMGHLMYSSNWRYMVLALTSDMQNDTSMLYFYVTDSDGEILLCDDTTRVGMVEPLRVPLVQPGGEPVSNDIFYTLGGNDAINFNAYRTQLKGDTRFNGRLRGEQGEEIFDTIWDIRYMGESLGALRMGYSRKAMTNKLIHIRLSILGVGFLVLIVVLSMIVVVVKTSMAPLEAFIRSISAVRAGPGREDLKQRLEKLSFDQIPRSTLEMENLNLAFDNLRNMVVSTWEELEQHRDSLESMVLERTRELEMVNLELEKRILERQEIEEKLLNAQKLEALGTLAGGVAHDFNNLLMAIQGNAGLIRRWTEPGEVSNQKAKKINDLVDTGARVVRQLLGFARGGKYAPAPLSINEVLERNLDMFSRTRKDLEIHCRYQEKVWQVEADRSQMEQVVLNLFLNASEAMPSSSLLSVETQNIILDGDDLEPNGLGPGRFVKFSVTDRGGGMDDETRNRVFDPFFTTKQMGRGTGLGLASVYGIVRNHGGVVTVRSSPGQGSTFSVVLPALNLEEN